MEEAPSSISFPSLIDRVHDCGPIETFGWLSLLIVIIMGCILLIVPRRSGRGASLVDLYAACLHIQTLVFIFCVPLSLAAVTYLTLSRQPYVYDMVFSAASVLVNLTVSGVFLGAVSIRHKAIPAIEWLPVVSVITSIVSLFAVWQCRMAAFMWYE